MVAVQAAGTQADLAFPRSALAYGFANEPVGTHISRTLMLADLRRLLAACPPSADPATYAAAVVDENVLLKPTVTTRRQSIRRLKELYRLDRKVILFRALRDLWDADTAAQPLLALLCAVATDPLLRCTADLLLSLPVDAEVTPQQFEAVVKESFPGRYSPASLASIGRNVASSWQQSGHLRGKLRKIRVHAVCRPPALVYALLLGALQEVQGEALFATLWCRLLDTPGHVLHSQAVAASQRGWLEYRRAGSVTEVGFRYLLREDEERADSR
jgi:hypothetical protein